MEVLATTAYLYRLTGASHAAVLGVAIGLAREGCRGGNWAAFPFATALTFGLFFSLILSESECES